MTFFNWWNSVPPFLEFIVLVSAAIAASAVIYKYVFRPIQSWYRRWNSAIDTLHGYEPVTDPGTGREIQPATPPLAKRVYDLEQTNAKVAEAVDRMAAVQEQIVEHFRTNDELIAEWTAWREQHEQEAADREARLLEFQQWQAEQATLWEILRTNMAVEGTKQIVKEGLLEGPDDTD